MSLKPRYDAYESAQPHRVPRCKSCHLVLPCRADGKYGPCDARVVSHESHAAVCRLFAAVMDPDATVTAAERPARLAEARAQHVELGRTRTHCVAGHEQTDGNVYEYLRTDGRYNRRCAVCQRERQCRKRLKEKEQNEQAAA